MLLSNPKIDYSSVRRIPSVKLSGQTQETTTTTTATPTNTMSTSTSLQDISSHHKKKLMWNNNNNKDERLINYYEKVLSSNTGRPLNSSQSDERIFEHPEVTIKPSALDDEIQRRLLTIRTSSTTDNFTECEGGQSVPNILEHPDMRSPVVMQTQPLSSSLSTSSFTMQNTCNKINRAQSVDAPPIAYRTPSPSIRVDACDENNQNSSRSVSFSSFADDIGRNPEQTKNEDNRSLSFSKGDFILELPDISSKSNMDSIETEQNDSS